MIGEVLRLSVIWKGTNEETLMIGEILRLLVYLFLEIMNCCLAYVLFFGAKITSSRKKIIFCTGSLLMFHCFILIAWDMEAASATPMFTMILIPMFLFEVFDIRYLYIYPFVALASSILGINASYFLGIALELSVSEIIQGNWYTIICQSVPTIVMLMIYLLIKLRKCRPFQINLDLKQYIVLYAAAIGLFFMVAPMQSMAEGDFDEWNINAVGAASSLGCTLLVFVTIWQGISVKKETEQKEKSVMFEKYLSIQREYYESLLYQEERMRRFYHDMNAHITALQAYASNQEIENLQIYLSRMRSESAIDDIHKFTGNKIVDALITKLKEDAERKDILFEVQGYLQEESAEKSYDLCTIISNLLKNAIEACEEIDDKGQRKISLKANMYEKRICIIVNNSVKERVKLKEKFPVRTREAGIYHGLGYGNLEATVQKYDGIIECRADEKEFEAEIVI